LSFSLLIYIFQDVPLKSGCIDGWYETLGTIAGEIR